MTIIPLFKKCRDCGLEKPNSEFYKVKIKYFLPACKECTRKAVRQRRKNDPERVRDLVRKARQRTPSKVKAWRERGREKNNARTRERYANDLDFHNHRKQQASQYQKNHPDLSRAVTAKRRAKKSNGNFTHKEWKMLQAWFGGKCLRCGSIEKLSPDHVIPLFLGGQNIIENIQPLCLHCNISKHIKTTDYRDPVQFKAFLNYLKRASE